MPSQGPKHPDDIKQDNKYSNLFPYYFYVCIELYQLPAVASSTAFVAVSSHFCPVCHFICAV